MIPTPDGGFIIIPTIVIVLAVRYGPRALAMLGASLSASWNRWRYEREGQKQNS